MTAWRHLPHQPLEKLNQKLWRVDGSLPSLALRRTMTVMRLDDGGLVVHSAVSCDEATMREIDAWGPVRYLVVPNGYHRLDAPAWKARYPDALVLCPPGVHGKVAERVAVDGHYDRLAGLQVELLDGTGEREGVFIVEAEDGISLVFNDAVFNHPHFSGFTGWMFRLLGSTGKPTVTPTFRLAMVKDKPAFRAHLTRLAALPKLRRLVVAHGDVIDERPAEVLQHLATF